MIEFLPYRPAHLDALELQDAQDYLRPILAEIDYAAALEMPGLSWSGTIDGAIVGCAGIAPLCPWRATTWALLGEIPKREWMRLTRRVVHGLNAAHRAGYRRIEATVEAGFAAGERWVQCLGFTCETPEGMRCYSPDGRTFRLYSRIAP